MSSCAFRVAAYKDGTNCHCLSGAEVSHYLGNVY